MFFNSKNNNGFSALLLVAGVTVLLFVIITSVVPFRDQMMSSFYPKDVSNAAAPLQSGSKISWQGKNWNITGVNVPWYNWACDFGCNMSGGVMGTKNEIAPRFQQLKDAKIHMVRWWLFPGDNIWQITVDGTGKPTGINPAVYADIDAALQMAETYDLYYNFVLFSAANHPPRSWLENTTHRTALAQVIGNLAARYKDNPRMMSWEIFNEPEWQIWNGLAPEAASVATAKAITDSVHANSDALVTIGQANLEGIPMWDSVDLDYHSPHWYDPMSSGNACAICTDYNTVKARYGITKPIVLGEVYIGDNSQNDLDKLNSLYTKGYAGIWGWSLFYERTGDQLPVNFNAVISFTSSHNDIGPSEIGLAISPLPSASLSPSQSPSVQPQTFYATLTASQEVQTPIVSSPAMGTGTLVLAGNQTTATVSLSLSDLTSAQSAAHIHGPATMGVNASAVFTLPNGNFTNHQITLTSTQVTQLKNGQFYFNIHTSNFPNGEIRGQITTQAPSPSPSINPSPSSIVTPGDIDGNGRVNIFDYNLLLTDFGVTSGLGLRSDLNKNGRVDIFDYNILLTNFGK